MLSALDTQDDFVQLKAAQILTVLLSAEPNPVAPHYLQPFLSTLASFVQGVQTNKKDVGVQCLEALLPRAECRKAVWGIPGVIAGLVCNHSWVSHESTYSCTHLIFRRLTEILKHTPTPQMSYQVGFCFWLLTFEQEIARQINK